MRADRLVATLLLMQARRRVTARQLADELEISVATARRDLEALSAAGIPVYPQPGRGGGWSLLGGSRTDLTGLTSAEARALFLLVGPRASGAADARSALRKLLRALPETFRADAEAAADAVVIDAAAWGRPERRRPVHLDALEQAVVQRVAVRIRYRPWGEDASERMVEPWGVVDKSGTWYLIAGAASGRRSYRVDRIEAVEPTDAVFAPPPEFSLEDAWQEVVREVETRQRQASAEILIDANALPLLRSEFGVRLVEHGIGTDGRVRATASMQTPLWLARRLAPWGSAVEVLSPSEVRDELVRIGEELVGRNR